MVEFVNDDVVERVWGEPLEMLLSAEGLDGREDWADLESGA
jgi:hypothetical protein